MIHAVETALLRRFQFPIEEIDALKVYSAWMSSPKMLFRSLDHGKRFAALGSVLQIAAEGLDRAASVREQFEEWIETLGLSDSPVRAFGGFAFGHDKETGIWADFPGAFFFVPLIEIQEDEDGATVVVFAEDLEKAQSLIASLTNQKPIPNKTGQTKMISRMDQVTWKNSLSEALKAIANGEMSKVVVARVLELRSSLNIPAEQALALLQTQYPSTYQIGLSPKDGSHLISASPERLVRIANGQLETMALAGTFPRGEEQIDPAAITKSMMANPKERQEHEIVRSEIMGQLRPFCRDLDIAPEPGIRELPNVFHLHSLIHGKLRSGQHILDIVETLHPTPALGGRPRDAALDLIARVETQSRGWYGAPIGYFDNQGEGDFAVAIRSAVVRDQRAWLYAGAGIVTGSSPTKEWEETNAKLLPMLDAFEVGI